MKNKITDLRNHLFEVIEALKEGDESMTIERAMAIKDVAQVIVNSAKVEVDFAKATGSVSNGSGFIPLEDSDTIKKIA